MTQTTEETRATRTAKLEAARSMLASAVATLQSSEGFIRTLTAMAKAGKFSLRRLSFRNQLIAITTRPNVSEVATFRAWQNAGRQVQKGERSITILAPVVTRRKSEKEGEESESVLCGFRPHAVFDISQTQPIPGRDVEARPDISQFVKNIEDYGSFAVTADRLRDVALALGEDVVSGIEFRPRTSSDPRDAHGWFDPRQRTIVVVSGETSRAMQTKTAIHEIAHAILHGAGSGHDRAEGEVEAESTAYICCHAIGIDSAPYSAGYIASWNQEDGAQQILRCGQRIMDATNRILDVFENEHSKPSDLKQAA